MTGGSPSTTILTGQTERIASVTTNPWIPRLARLTVAVTFLLLIAGALVTGNKASLSDPTWPLFVGEWFPKYWIGGLLFEDSHRIIAGTVGILMLLLAILVQMREKVWTLGRFGAIALMAAVAETMLGAAMIYCISHQQINVNTGLAIHVTAMLLLMCWFLSLLLRRSIDNLSLRSIGWFGVWLVINQALLGGLVIHSIRTPVVSMVHGFVAQVFFCTVISLAVFSTAKWHRSLADERLVRESNDGFRKLARFIVAVAFTQVVIGTGVRHTAENFIPYILAHIGTGLFLLITYGLFAMRVYDVYRDVRFLRKTVHWIGGLLLSQVLLGICSAYSNRARLQPEMAHPWDVTVTTLHLIFGALILGLLFTCSLHVHRKLAPTALANGPEINASGTVEAS
jgi:heme A synthase